MKRRAQVRREWTGYVHGPHPADWKPEETALLGTIADNEVSVITGQTPNAVRIKPTKMGIRGTSE